MFPFIVRDDGVNFRGNNTRNAMPSISWNIIILSEQKISTCYNIIVLQPWLFELRGQNMSFCLLTANNMIACVLSFSPASQFLCIECMHAQRSARQTADAFLFTLKLNSVNNPPPFCSNFEHASDLRFHVSKWFAIVGRAIYQMGGEPLPWRWRFIKMAMHLQLRR